MPIGSRNNPNMAQHKLQRLAQAALGHVRHAAWVLVALGVVAFLLLPLAAKKCYLDEKALLLGGSLPSTR